ncbi:MAG: outer membrane protein transport protein [Deltaproteobacteria bacterium]|nr:outer membrane protein transport protein [Deltaproteobacteria bacterium]
MIRRLAATQIATLLFAAAVIIPTSANAGGLEVADLGSVALGRGTAFVARADNLSAFHYNPAGLSKQPGLNILVSGNVVNLNIDYQRAGSGEPVLINGWEVANPALDYSGGPEGVPFASVSSDHRFGPAPLVAFSWGDAFDVEGLALAVGLTTPSSFGMPAYPKNGPQRYAMRDANFLIVYPGLGASYSFNRYIQVGAVFIAGVAKLEQSQAIRLLPQPGNTITYNEHAEGDADLRIETLDPFMPTAIIGLLSNPLDWLEIGVAFKFPMKVEAGGTVHYKPPISDLPDSRLVPGRDSVTLRQTFPWVLRTGVRYIHQRFDVELDFVYEGWSMLQKFEVDMDADLDDGMAVQHLPDVDVPKHFRDAWSLRLGGDVEVWPEHIAIRIGCFYQASAYQENRDTFSLDFPYDQQIGVGGGLTWHAWKHLDVHAGYMHVFQWDVDVTDGIVQQQGMPLETADGPANIGNTVNNGHYEVDLNIFGASLEAHF